MGDFDIEVSLTDLYYMLEEHKWGWSSSKDPNELQEGADWWKMILNSANTVEKMNLINDYQCHIAFGTPKPPEPKG